MILFDHVSKIYCRDINASRKSAVSRILGFNQKGHSLKESEFYAIQDISFSLDKGKSLVIVFDSHLAKSAMTGLLCGLTGPSSGSINIDGRTRLVSNSSVGATPFMSVKDYLYLLSMLYGLDRKELSETADRILQSCEMKDQVGAKIGELEKSVVDRLSHCASLLIDADVYVFNKLKFESSEYGERCKNRFEEIMNTRTAVILEDALKESVVRPDHVMFIDGGKKLYFGAYGSAVEVRKIVNHLEIDKESPEKDVSVSISNILSNHGNYRKIIQKETGVESPNQEALENALEVSIGRVVEEKLDRLSKEQKPVIAGPFISDVGIELIYWIPFLRWLIESYGLDRKNFVAVSRCGADRWYQDLGVEYVDLCDILDQEKASLFFKDRISSGKIKQFTVTEIEKPLLDTVSEKKGIIGYHHIHPSVMYNLFLPVWKRSLPEKFIRQYTKYKPLGNSKSRETIEGLPKDYIAVKFSFCPQFPDHPQNRLFLKEIIDRVSTQFPIVNLSTGIQIDMHEDFSPASNGEFNLKGRVNHRNLLEVQTAVIGNAKLFLGTHSNISYLAPLMGVKTTTLYSEANAGIFPVNFWLFNSFSSDLLRENFSALNVSLLNPDEVVHRIKLLYEGEQE